MEPDKAVEESVVESTDVTDTDARNTNASAANVRTSKKVTRKNVEKKVEIEAREESPKRKNKFVMEECLEEKWTCNEDPLWRVYMKTYVDEVERLDKEDKLKRRKPADLPKLPRVKSDEVVKTPYKCVPLNVFQLEAETTLPNKLDRSKMKRIWRDMRMRRTTDTEKSMIGGGELVSKTDSDKWPGVWPCDTRDLVAEWRKHEDSYKKKRMNVFPCDKDEDREVKTTEGTADFAARKELGHARIPVLCPIPKMKFMVDRATGEHPGLVDGDYVIFELSSKAKGVRLHADVCLHGLKGMHLPELGPLRERRKTWKFCFYQALVALLAKTQLRYKYVWTANIDYIYDHAWMLFVHIGTLNVKDRQRLDDVIVYNYKYSVELELVQEMKDIPKITTVDFNYEERQLKRKMVLERKDLASFKLLIGSEKITDQFNIPVHKNTRDIENWFDKLPIRYRNCIFRTTRYSLAFWRDGTFWYLYNPYRCNEFGYWDDNGYACIVKFCTKNSLKRHLVILLLRAYSYETPKSQIPMDVYKEPSKSMDDDKTTETENGTEKEEVFTIQIYNMIYHCCQIYNLRLLERRKAKPPWHYIKKKIIDDCLFDPLDRRDPCTIEQEEGDLKDSIEKPTWFKLFKLTWARCVPSGKKKLPEKEAVSAVSKMRWHQYQVEESNKLFSLWGELHITDGMFDQENRGMQTYACYVVCAGMTRIMAPEYWSSKTLDVIVMCGDRYYTHSKLEAEFKSSKPEYEHVGCWNRYLTNYFKIGETMFEAKVLPSICGRLYSKSNKYLWQSLEQMFLRYHFGILTCESSCLGIFKFCGAYYMLDVNSYGPPLFQYGDGAAYLLRSTYFYKFMTVLILTIGSPECCQFALNPIEILKVIDVGGGTGAEFYLGPAEGTGKSRRRKKIPCPYDEEKKKQMRKWKTRRAEEKRTIDKTCCKDEDDI